ncbi:hypothetical protein [Phyllobacterium bourgognense]|uniref:Uncharacterized protein n=1 Tax=Phyllobacterium bourgognense TaxID=314236 RepID=A0A368YS11_9HYPH|nr:hypothetical protein [Phyllobacterium bourgognense]RCW80934.1 hypothetical protein C7476_11290 [Phyllobacterium bourgognense]
MMVATFNDENFPIGFYSEEVHGNRVPPEAVEITDEQWIELYTYQGARKFEDGAVIEYTPEPVIPDRVSRRQFRLQLIDAGLLSQVEAWIATQDIRTQAAYADSGTFLRSDEMLQEGFAGLGFTVEQVDAFFMEASAL